MADRSEIGLPSLGQREGPVGTAEQPRAEAFLQSAHELTDRTGGDGQFAGGLLHAEVPGGRLEGAQGVEGWQAGHAPRIEFLNRECQEELFVTTPIAPHFAAPDADFLHRRGAAT